MEALEQPEEEISTDILVLGGGMAGLCAAIKARESGSSVLVVDKGGIGWAGQVPLGGGSLAYLYPDQVERFCKFVTEFNKYLNNQEWTLNFAQRLNTVHNELDAMGVPFLKNNNKIAIISLGKDNHRTRFDAPRAMIKLRQAALNRGVKTIDKVFVVDLLLSENQVIGAIGFGLVDGKTYIFRAKSVILATGTCRFQAEKEFGWTSGEGETMAFRAGAQLMNAEFRSLYFHSIKALQGKQFMSGISLHFFLENDKGERIVEKYYPDTVVGKKPGQENVDSLLVLDSMLREVEAGRGPIYLNISKLGLTPEEKERLISMPYTPGFRELYSFNSFRLLKDKVGTDASNERIEVVPLYGGGAGTLRIDLNCCTSLKGLWAAGDICSSGSSWSGSRLHVMGGTGIGFAAVSGLIAGENAGKYSTNISMKELDVDQVAKTKARIFNPLRRVSKFDISNIIYQIHEAVIPMKYSFKREAGRMKEALKILELARKSLGLVGVKDFHELSRYHQAESMILAGEHTFQAALLREESRGQHIREDFPIPDDKRWLKWIVLERRGDGLKMNTEPVPLDSYRFRP